MCYYAKTKEVLRTKNINVNVNRPPTNIPLGRQGENLATCIIFDCTGLVQLYGDGTAELLHELKGGTVYPVAVTQDGASVSWTVSASDTAIVGSGRAELRWYVGGDTLAKSAKFRTSVSSALADSTTETPPEPQKSWVDKVLAAAQEIKDGAISDEQLADAIAKALADASASGEFDGAPGLDGTDGGYYAPSVDDDGNLTWTASADNMPAVTGANIKGPQGNKGETGATGAQGPAGAEGSPGADGADGVGIQSVVQTTTSAEDGGTNIVTVTKTDGSTSTFEVRNGSKGNDGVPGVDGKDGADGQPGTNGKTAYQYAQEGGFTGTEVEFAAKLAEEIPDKLPNPNALTFTGAATGSYDGSVPVSVKIPEGGSGEAWELIDSVTLSEDVAAVTFDFDTPYKKILFMCQPNVGVSGWKHLSINKGYWIPCANISITSTHALFIEIGAGKRLYQAKDNQVFARVRITVEQISMPQNGTLDTYDGNLWVDVAGDYFGHKHSMEINSVAMQTAEMCVAGAYFEVWGVKA